MCNTHLAVGSVRRHGSADDLAGLEEEGWWNGQPKGLGRLQVDDQFELHGLLHGQVRRRGAFQDAIHVVGGAPVHVMQVHAVGHQPSRLRILPKKEDRR
jgi:hypothetical protein